MLENIKDNPKLLNANIKSAEAELSAAFKKADWEQFKQQEQLILKFFEEVESTEAVNQLRADLFYYNAVRDTRNKNYVKAREALLEGIEFMEKNSNQTGTMESLLWMARAYSLLGSIAEKSENYQEALEDLTKANGYLQELVDKSSLVEYSFKLALNEFRTSKILEQLDELKEADSHLAKAENTLDELKSSLKTPRNYKKLQAVIPLYLRVLENSGIVFRKMKNEADANMSFDEFLTNSENFVRDGLISRDVWLEPRKRVLRNYIEVELENVEENEEIEWYEDAMHDCFLLYKCMYSYIESDPELKDERLFRQVETKCEDLRKIVGEEVFQEIEEMLEFGPLLLDW